MRGVRKMWGRFALACCVVLLAAPVVTLRAAQAGEARPDDELLGVWVNETTSGPQVRGELVLERDDRSWTARVGGFEVVAPRSGDSVHVVLPGGEGELRAHLEDGGRTVRGFWIQPAGLLPPYASPILLRRMRSDAWRGTVVPRDDRFSLYLLIQRAEDGSLRGSFHNPEFGWNGGAPWFRLTRDGDVLVFTDPASGKVRYRQPYDSGQRRISMDFGRPLFLTPRRREQAVGLFPRTPEGAPYEYRVPVPESDGWPTARATDVGMDEAALRDLVRHIADTEPSAAGAPLIHSVLVARHGKLVLEEYFFGFGADQPHDLRSASKTLTSLMAGVAMDLGALDPGTPVLSLFPRDTSGEASAALDARKERMTVGQLLTHSSGLACDDNDDASPGNEQVMQEQQRQPDWYRYILDLPVAHEPGTTYAYCSGGMNLAGGAVAAATRSWLPDFFDRHIARPLGIERYHINLMPSGQAYSGGGMYLRPRDLLKIGQTYLDGGVWRGRRVVSRRWVEASTAHRLDTPNGASDGYGWHRYRLEAGGRSYQEYEASGNGGQFLIVVPELDVAVVFTAGNYGRYGVWRRFREELAPRYVLGAVRR
jgi:CubicO group peptidase (beta-lactamase class C family)